MNNGNANYKSITAHGIASPFEPACIYKSLTTEARNLFTTQTFVVDPSDFTGVGNVLSIFEVPSETGCTLLSWKVSGSLADANGLPLSPGNAGWLLWFGSTNTGQDTAVNPGAFDLAATNPAGAYVSQTWPAGEPFLNLELDSVMATLPLTGSLLFEFTYWCP